MPLVRFHSNAIRNRDDHACSWQALSNVHMWLNLLLRKVVDSKCIRSQAFVAWSLHNDTYRVAQNKIPHHWLQRYCILSGGVLYLSHPVVLHYCMLTYFITESSDGRLTRLQWAIDVQLACSDLPSFFVSWLTTLHLYGTKLEGRTGAILLHFYCGMLVASALCHLGYFNNNKMITKGADL